MKEQERFCEELSNFLKLRSNLVAVRILKNKNELPDNAVCPLRDLGHHYSLCQAVSQVRRQGKTIAMFREDHWCCEPVIGLGLAEPPQEFLDGTNRYPASARSLEAGSYWATHLPKLDVHEESGILLADWRTAEFEPDLIIMYCDTAQLTHLLISVNWIDGEDVPSYLSGHSACVYATVPVLQGKKFYVSVPCIGDRKRAAAQDNEIIFSFKPEMAQLLIDGLKKTSLTQVGFPIQYDVMAEYKLAPAYERIGKQMGMTI